jgi:hypothetical protein
MKRITLALLISAWPAKAGQTLTQTQIFQRCYSQLTQTSLNPADPLITPVKNGTKTAAVACMEIFDRGALGSNGRLAAVDDPVSLAVLRTMHRLHASWLSNRDFLEISGAGAQGVKDFYDIDSPAFYFTRAVLKTGAQFKSIVTSTKHLRAIRPSLPNLGISSRVTKEQTIFQGAANFAPVGALQGIEETGDMVTNYSLNSLDGTVATGTFPLGKHYGAGILGSFPYLHQTINEERGLKSDGALHMPRKFARSVFSDLLCRTLPVVRYSDVGIYKNSTSKVTFRQSQGCVQCHASMDQMSAVIRGFRYNILESNDGVQVVGLDGGQINPPTTTTSETQWPISADTSYSSRPPKGVFYFRDSNGDLVNIPLTDLVDLGNTLAELPDFYLCAASRYYAYFTGVEVEINDPVMEGQTSTVDKAHRTTIESLATTLKSTQSARSMLNALFSLPQYRNSSFQSER